MISLVKDNLQFTLVLLIWMISGAIAGPLAFGVVGISVLLLGRKDFLPEVFIGFWLVLMMSDSRLDWMLFTGKLKVVYIVLLLLLFFIRRKDLMASPNNIIKLFVPFFVWSGIMIVNSPDIFQCLQKTISYFLLYLVIPILVNFMLVSDQRRFVRTVMFFVFVYLGAALVLKFVAPTEMFLAGRYRGFMGNPNGLGVLVALIFILFDNFIKGDPKAFSKMEKVLLWAVIILSLYYCRSRSALFTLLVYFAFSRFKLLHGFLGFMFFVTVLVSYSFISENLPMVIRAIGLDEFLRVETLDQASGRFIAWNFAWESIQDQFFIGKGFNYTEYLYGINYTKLSRIGHLGNAHNSFLTFWLDTGLIGLVLFIIPFILLFFRISKTNSIAIPVLYAILFSANFESWLIGSLNPFTICLLTILTVLDFNGDIVEKPEELEDQQEIAVDVN